MSNDTPHSPPTPQVEIPLAPGPYPVRYLIHSLPGTMYKGDALDITPRGFRLHTRHPIPTEECLEIEVTPRNNTTKQDPLLVRGQVLCCETAPEGGYLLSVKTFMKFPEHAEDLFATATKENSFLTPASLFKPAAQPLHSEAQKEHFQFSDLRGPLLVVCLLLLMLLLFFPLYRIILHNPSGSLTLRQTEGQYPPLEAADKQQENSIPLYEPPVSDVQHQEPLREGILRIQGAPTELPDVSALMPPLDSPFFDEELPYSSGALEGDAGPSRGALDARPLPAYGTLPNEAGRSASKDAAPPAMYPALTLKPAAAPSRKEKQRYIEIQKSEHLLSFFEDQRLLATFPIGLGVANSTPEGHFVIANKLLHPDWFNKGDTVKAGDPENPLGDHWMGLGRNGTATSYGIHPTQEKNSIGDDQSRGCIRMYPDDAKKLFAWCDVGTPVLILP